MHELEGGGRDDTGETAGGPRHSFRENACEGELSLEMIFSLLSNERRRLVLRHLARAEGEVAFRDLVQQVAAWENGVDTTEVTYEQRKRVYTSLHQIHLPKLEDAEVVESFEDGDRFCLTERAEELNFTLSECEGGSGGDAPANDATTPREWVARVYRSFSSRPSPSE